MSNYFSPHRTLAACLAICFRCFLLSFFALALPPLEAPNADRLHEGFSLYLFYYITHGAAGNSIYDRLGYLRKISLLTFSRCHTFNLPRMAERVNGHFLAASVRLNHYQAPSLIETPRYVC